MKPCLLIPIYNHPDTIAEVVRSLEYLNLPCFIVNDGSDAATRRELARIEQRHPWVRVEHRSENGGRGAALKTGYRLAASVGMTHAVQLDADGQHDASDVPMFLQAAKDDPSALILGAPIFEASAPALRVQGRKLSQGLVWFQTLSFSIRDPLCGFRCLPLAATLALLDRRPMGERMDFDLEIAVRLVWDGLPVINLPTHVSYFEDGVSHFALVYDNLIITGLHLRLVAGGVLRAPRRVVAVAGWRR